MKHALYAVSFQVVFGLLTGEWKAGGALAVGFFVGVEWMQEIRMKMQERGIRWPAPVSPEFALEGFEGWGRDRYVDCVLPAIACYLAVIIKEAL